MRKPSFSTEAIVLSAFAYGEGHSIASLLTPERGKLSVFVRNAQFPSKRSNRTVEALDYATWELTVPGTSSNLYGLKTVHSRHPWMNIRSSLRTCQLAWTALEVTSVLTHGDEAGVDAMYASLVECINCLETFGYSGKTLTLLRFIDRALQIFGSDVIYSSSLPEQQKQLILEAVRTERDVANTSSPQNWNEELLNYLLRFTEKTAGRKLKTISGL